MESISRISSLLETARDLTLEAARDAGPRSIKAIRPLPAPQIKKLLDSRSERDVLDGLRRVIAMQYSNPPQPTLPFFPAVLKTLSHPYPSTRPLVYNYLLHHADADPDTALLAINTIQKSLSDANPRIRAMALKTMSGIRVPVISQIVSLAIKKGVSDLSPLVRKVAALACAKCVRLDQNTRPQVEDYVAALLSDKQYYVAGAAVQAFMDICPDRIDLIHPVYRRLCKMIVDMDEWAQLATIRLMTVYARKCFPRTTKRVKRKQTQADLGKDFYEELDPEQENEADFEDVEVVDPDLELFRKSIEPLLHSRNSAVILSVVRAHLYLLPSTYLPQTIGPLMALLRSPNDIQQIALHNIVQVCLVRPDLFLPYMRHFLLRSSEPPSTWRLKLEVLTLIFPYSPKEHQDLILAELEHFSHGHADPELVRESVKALGRCAQTSSPKTSRRCLTLLLKQIHSPDANLVGEAMEVVRHLIQRSPSEHHKTVVRLAKNLDTLTSPTARASVVWLVGEFAAGSSDDEDGEEGIAADVLRILVRGYADEQNDVKAQIIVLAAKVYLHHLNAKNAKQKALDALAPSDHEGEGANDTPAVNAFSGGFDEDREGEDAHPVVLLFQHTMLLARYTPSYDLRDRARQYRALLALPSSTELATLLLLAPKPVPQAPSPSAARKHHVLGSAGLVVGAESPGEALPDWVVEGEEPDPALRDVEIGEMTKGAGTTVAASAGQRLDEALELEEKNGAAGGKKQRTLDAWLDEEDDEESEDSGETETESESEEEDEEYESESESEGEDDEKATLVR